MKRVIHFEDKGQDFLTWTVDADGLVIDCQPFQAWLWVGMRVLAPGELKPGGHVRYSSRQRKGVQTIRYPIAAIEELPTAAGRAA